ncbi:hypothetical protein GCM10009623_37210 [Nocardioides aestuarii]|uniref:Quinol monooxygenase n=1 Tax=Nocardioides aestuarii TaxID=252231 RepID=A0ABW4TR21_9ACTN
MTRQVVVTTIPVLPEHHETSAAALSDFVARMRDVEGCLGFDVYESSATPGSFVTIAQWADHAAFEAHRGSPAVVEAMQAAQPFLSGRPTVDPLVPVDAVEP